MNRGGNSCGSVQRDKHLHKDTLPNTSCKVFLGDLRTLCKVYPNDVMIAMEAATQGVTVREHTVSGLMLADDIVRISGKPEGL